MTKSSTHLNNHIEYSTRPQESVIRQRKVIENRVINLCYSRLLKESLMDDIDKLCDLVRREAKNEV